MFRFSVKGTTIVLAGLLAGTLLLSGCMAASPTALAAAQAATVMAPASTGPSLPAPAAGNAASAAVSSAPAQQAPSVGTSRTITVIGHGEVKAQPDVARSSIGIEVTAPTVAQAMRQARGNMDAVLKALKAAGIADKDIQTNNFSINFERQQPNPVPLPAQSGPSATGTVSDTTNTVAGVYHVTNTVNVTIRDLAKVGPVVDAAVNAGANNVWGINFGLDSTTALEAQAREKAVADARARAQSLAQLNGVTAGGVVSVSEVIGQAGPRMALPAAQAVGMGGGGTPVEPGELTFSTDIQVVYAIQ